MAESDRPRSPFAATADFSAQRPVRVLSPDEIEQLLASHLLYLKTEYHEGHRADFSSADLTGFDFAGRDLRGIKMDRAVLRGANFTGANLRAANLIGAIAQEGRFDRADLSPARLSGANLVAACFVDACLAKAEMEFAVVAKAVLQGACLCEADMSGTVLDGAALTRADLRKANLRGAGLRDAQFDSADLRDARLGGAFLATRSSSASSIGSRLLYPPANWSMRSSTTTPSTSIPRCAPGSSGTRGGHSISHPPRAPGPMRSRASSPRSPAGDY